MKGAFQYYTDGFAAAKSGLPLESCELLYAHGWPREAWEVGWQWGEILRKLETGFYDTVELERIEKSPFDQGKVANMKGIALADCPYGEGADKTAWESGWISEVEAEPDCSQRRISWEWMCAAGIVALVWALLIYAFMTNHYPLPFRA